MPEESESRRPQRTLLLQGEAAPLRMLPTATCRQNIVSQGLGPEAQLPRIPVAAVLELAISTVVNGPVFDLFPVQRERPRDRADFSPQHQPSPSHEPFQRIVADSRRRSAEPPAYT